MGPGSGHQISCNIKYRLKKSTLAADKRALMLKLPLPFQRVSLWRCGTASQPSASQIYSAKNTNCKKFPFQGALKIERVISALFGRAVLVLKRLSIYP